MKEEKGETRVVDDDDKYHSIRSSNKKKKKKRGATEKKSELPVRHRASFSTRTNRTDGVTLWIQHPPPPFCPVPDRWIVKDMQTADDSIDKVGWGYKVYGGPLSHQNRSSLYSDAFRNSLPGGLVDSRHVSFSSTRNRALRASVYTPANTES